MNHLKTAIGLLPGALSLLAASSLLMSACVDDEPGIEVPNGAGNNAGGSTGAQAGSAGASIAGASHQTGGSAGSQASGGSGAGASNSAQAGATEMGEGGAAGAGNDDGVGGQMTEPQACIFHTDAPPGESEGEGGAGPAPTITVQTSAFVGSYLADGAGRTLYVYGADLPGDCRADNVPTSRCDADCLVSWPSFDAGARVLGPGLSDVGFGSIVRGDGLAQTTYFGWPLYYYKTDLTFGQMTGQGKGKTWQVAETTPASIVIMKEGAVKYLADGNGRTLYVSSADAVGTGSSDPVSACSGPCLQTFERFQQKSPTLVQSLEQQDFSVFVAAGNQLQLAFKGQPLYKALADHKAGDTTGTATTGFTAALP